MPTATPGALTTTDSDRLDAVFAALANSTRRSILDRLAGGAASVNDLAEPFDLSLPAISKHIKVLERAGLVTRRREAQFRRCVIDAAPLAEVAGWAERYRPIWNDRFDRFDEQLRSRDDTDHATPHTTPHTTAAGDRP